MDRIDDLIEWFRLRAPRFAKLIVCLVLAAICLSAALVFKTNQTVDIALASDQPVTPGLEQLRLSGKLQFPSSKSPILLGIGISALIASGVESVLLVVPYVRRRQLLRFLGMTDPQEILGITYPVFRREVNQSNSNTVATATTTPSSDKATNVPIENNEWPLKNSRFIEKLAARGDMDAVASVVQLIVRNEFGGSQLIRDEDFETFRANTKCRAFVHIGLFSSHCTSKCLSTTEWKNQKLVEIEPMRSGVQLSGTMDSLKLRWRQRKAYKALDPGWGEEVLKTDVGAGNASPGPMDDRAFIIKLHIEDDQPEALTGTHTIIAGASETATEMAAKWFLKNWLSIYRMSVGGNSQRIGKRPYVVILHVDLQNADHSIDNSVRLRNAYCLDEVGQ
jgi:hypothetical protein